MKHGALRIVLILGVGLGLGSLSQTPPAWGHGGGGGGGASEGGAGGSGGVSVNFAFSPAPRTALSGIREIYIVQTDGAFTDLMMPRVQYFDGAVEKTFGLQKKTVGIYTVTRKNHHPDAFTYLFTGRAMTGEEVSAEFPVTVGSVEAEVEWEDDGVNPNGLDPTDEIHLVIGMEPDEIEIPSGGSVDVTFQFSLRDHFGNPVSGIAPMIDVLLQDSIVALPGVDVLWNGGAAPPEILETPALGTYQTSVPYTFTEEGAFDLSIWIDFDLNATMDPAEVFTLTIEAEEE